MENLEIHADKTDRRRKVWRAFLLFLGLVSVAELAPFVLRLWVALVTPASVPVPEEITMRHNREYVEFMKSDAANLISRRPDGKFEMNHAELQRHKADSEKIKKRHALELSAERSKIRRTDICGGIFILFIVGVLIYKGYGI